MSTVACLLFCVFWITISDGAQFTKTESVLDKIKTGLRYASNYLERAKDIADLVSESLGHKHAQRREDGNDEHKEQFIPSNLVSALFRLLGLDSHKVAAIAVNSVIFLAQIISSLFGIKTTQGNIGRSIDEEELTWDPVKFIMENKNEKIKSLVHQAKDADLPNQLIERMNDSKSACIRLLLCKSSPVIRAAQNSLENKSRGNMYQMTAWMPSKDEFETNSDECEDRHGDCSLFPARQQSLL